MTLWITELGSLLGSGLTSATGEVPCGLSLFSSLGNDFDFLGGVGDRGVGGGDLPRPDVLLFLGLIVRDLFLDLDLLSLDLERRGLLDRLGLRVRERVLDLRYLLVGGDLLLLSSYLLRPERPLERDLLDLSLLLDLERERDLDLPRDGDLRLPRLSSRSRSDSDFLDLCEEDTSSLRVMTDAGTGGGGADSGGGGGGGAAAELGGGGGGAGCMPVDEEVAGGGTAFGGVVESGEWPDDCFETGVGGKGGGPESLLLFRLGEEGSVENGPVDDDSDELELFGM